MCFIDGDGSIIIPKSVRPIIDYRETCLGDKKGAKRQFRHGNLHIREYDNHDTIHRDKIDPRTDPFAHLLVDAPEYLIAILSSISVGGRSVKLYIREERQKGRTKELLCAMQQGQLLLQVLRQARFFTSQAI